jgi:cytochrome c556
MKIKNIATFTLAFGLALSALQFSAPAQADPFTNAEDAVKYRQSALSLIRANFAHMSGMVRGEIEYDAAAFQERANALKHLSHIPFDAFSGAGYNVTANSDALPAIWENWDDFSEKAEAFIGAAYELATAAESDNMRTIRPRFMATARTCQQCHEGYRAD